MSAHGIDVRRARAIAPTLCSGVRLVVELVAEREQVGEQRVGDAVERRGRAGWSRARRPGSRRAPRRRAAARPARRAGGRRASRTPASTGTGSCATGDRAARRSSGSATCGRRFAPARVGAAHRVEPRPPAVGVGAALHHQEGDRVAGAGSPRRSIHSSSVSIAPVGSPPSIAADPGGHDLEHAATGVVHRLRAARRARRSAANVPGTGSPCTLRCAVRCVRSRSRARRPAATSRTIAVIASRSSAVGVAVRALAHHVGAQRGVGHLRADVERARHALERVEVLGEGLPVPLDAFGQRGAGDVLDALHQLDEPLVRVGAHGREADAAVAEDGGGDAVPARRREVRVPGGLAVEVGVHVDEPGRDEQTVGVELAPGAAVDPADLDDRCRRRWRRRR